jgi:hypothetical protein
MAIDSLLHELDVRFVALINGHPSARFEDWRYGTGEAMMADAHARIAHHEQRSRNEVGADSVLRLAGYMCVCLRLMSMRISRTQSSSLNLPQLTHPHTGTVAVR